MLKDIGKLKDVEKCWKGIGNLTSITKSATSVPITLSQKGESIADPIKIANIFNNVFSTISSKNQIKDNIFKKTFLTS